VPGPWSTANPPTRPGIGVNFIAAAVAAVESGVGGTALVVGQSNWGPRDKPYEVLSQGDYDNGRVVDNLIFGGYGNQAASTLRNGVLDAFSGMNDGGASRVLALRITGSGAVAASVALDDTPAVDALTITARYAGTRANNFHVTVQTNAVNGSNKDLILYESGVELERVSNVTGGTNTNFAAAINALNSRYVTAAVTGAGARALANIVGAIGGAGGFGTVGGGVAGADGAAYNASDLATALTLANGYDFQSANVAELSDSTMSNTFAAWLRDYNETGRRCFGVLGAVAAETQATAAARAALWDDSPTYATYRTVARDLVVLTTDLLRISDGVVIPSARAASRLSGYLAGIGINRSPVWAKLDGYQVNNPYTAAAEESAQTQGIMFFANDTINRVRIAAGNTAMITYTTADGSSRPAAHKKIENVAIDHVVESTITTTLADPSVARLRNTQTGRLKIVSDILEYLRTLERLQVIESGSSIVDLDGRFVQTGNAVFIAGSYAYLETIERILINMKVRG
jgi:hypothetical protein